ncbi:hypothetical protein [Streptomyces virginiae]|uniref:hypothetical protein n=1 Tax=Streptomyces virginiae TaxID=1961 RepID=UPI003F5401B8
MALCWDCGDGAGAWTPTLPAGERPADAPTAALELDTTAAAAVLRLLRDAVDSLGAAIVMVTTPRPPPKPTRSSSSPRAGSRTACPAAPPRPWPPA